MLNILTNDKEVSNNDMLYLLREVHKEAMRKNASFEVMNLIVHLKDNIGDWKINNEILELSELIQKVNYQNQEENRDYDRFKSKNTMNVYNEFGVRGVLTKEVFEEYYKIDKESHGRKTLVDMLETMEYNENIKPLIFEREDRILIEAAKQPISCVELKEQLDEIDNRYKNLNEEENTTTSKNNNKHK